MGRFWHLFICNEQGFSSAAISQDDDHIFTCHLLLPMEADHESIDSHDAVYRVLGGMGGPFKVDIDEILVRSTYRHSIAVARSYRSKLGKIFLAGDAAHQNVPTGGYGMNMVSLPVASASQMPTVAD
jgi:FAD-dependent monooxygenase